MAGRVLVTGGAGYVGSHCARRLAEAGYEVVTVDDLSQGHAEAVVGELVRADLRDRARMEPLLGRGFDAVLHFAARMSVGESVADPVGYFDSNVAGTLSLLSAMRTHGCERLVFSSTCAVHGVPAQVPIAEDAPFAPISPYGETKAVVERILALARSRGQLAATCLRYFNAAGAAHDGLLGEAHHPETHLIPLALDAALHGSTMTVFGDQHATPDGTCVRDYVHVEDLAEAHLLALQQLLNGSPGEVYNLGSGDGYSVRAVLDTVAQVTGRPVHRTVGPAREGDPAVLISDTRKSTAQLGWRARWGLRDILEHAWRWHQAPRFGPRKA
jgi:UDP-glucose 4-epimerase